MKANIEKIVENRGMEDVILEVVVPTEIVVEIKAGKRKDKSKKIFPGYALVKMIMTDESWYVVRNTRGVTGFVGPGSKPIPLTDEEVLNMGLEKRTIEVDFEVGDSITVISGPFETFVGTIEEIHMERQSIKAILSMFGRETPVELEFDQVEKN
ncbi:transcriptional antiterminator NusG [Fusibacter tunisiensis]|uniref:Transcription termination/antitermination protein NusG n=1 Tax=Fusibacter tunisiensis TaxID=1008308 RepID=A0ABS2MR37_9FIRM|nr:transcriptional antiterminator NusG [Fusibacter tunisiensis]